MTTASLSAPSSPFRKPLGILTNSPLRPNNAHVKAAVQPPLLETASAELQENRALLHRVLRQNGAFLCARAREGLCLGILHRIVRVLRRRCERLHGGDVCLAQPHAAYAAAAELTASRVRASSFTRPRISRAAPSCEV